MMKKKKKGVGDLGDLSLPGTSIKIINQFKGMGQMELESLKSNTKIRWFRQKLLGSKGGLQ